MIQTQELNALMAFIFLLPEKRPKIINPGSAGGFYLVSRNFRTTTKEG